MVFGAVMVNGNRSLKRSMGASYLKNVCVLTLPLLSLYSAGVCESFYHVS